MIPHGVEIFLAVDHIDMRWGFNRLSGVVAEKIGRDVRCGALFLFFGRNRSTLKILFFDGTGLCLFYKRLDAGLFRVPTPPDENTATMTIDENILDALLDGVDLEAKPKTEKKARKTPRRQRKTIH